MPLRALLFLLLAAPSLAAGTLSHVSEPVARERHLTLRRDGGLLLIVDAASRTVLASAPAATTDRVVVRGASGPHDDTLTIDLGEPLALAGGIDYDGGAAGWDTLVMHGGAAREQRVTQLTPHDGVIDIDGLIVRYTNLEPITDTVPATNYTILGTAEFDHVTFSDGPGGTTTISAGTFESVTFANKTNVTYNGIAGDDIVSLQNPNPATGLTSLMLTNVLSVVQSEPLAYPSLGINATGMVRLDDLGNDAERVEITTQNGFAIYNDADDITIGGVSPTLAGVRVVQSGGVGVGTVGGNLVLDDSDAPEILRAGAASGDVTLSASGSTGHITVVPNRHVAIAPAGAVRVGASGDVRLGAEGAAFANDLRAATSVNMTVGGTLTVGGATSIISDAFATNSGGGVEIFFNYLVQTGGGRIVASGTAGGDVNVSSGGGSIELLGTVPGIESASGDAILLARGLTIAPTSGITAPLGIVDVRGHGVLLGTLVDTPGAPLELSDAELDRLTAPVVVVHGLTAIAAGIDVTQPITFTSGTELILRTAGTVNGAGGSISAPALTFEVPTETNKTWTITPTSVRIGSAAPVPYSAVTTLTARARVLSPAWNFPSAGADTFLVTPSATTTIHVDGFLPTPPGAGDVLDFDLTDVVNPQLSATFTATGYQGSLTAANRQPVHFQAIEQLVDAPVDLAITKSDGAATAVAGTPVTYTIVVTSSAPIPVAGATVTDVFPATLTGMRWTCAPSSGSACTSAGTGNISDTVMLAANGSLTYTVTATISPSAAAGTLTNSATVTTPAGYTENAPANNSATDTTTVATAANLIVQKTTANPVAGRGETLTYAITLRNAGPSDAQSVTLTDVLPANTSFVSFVAPAEYTCVTPAAGATGTVTCTRAVLPPSTAADSFTLRVRIDPAAGPGTTIANSVTATSTTPDPSPGNNSATAVLSIRLNIPTLSTLMLGVLAGLLTLVAVRAMR